MGRRWSGVRGRRCRCGGRASTNRTGLAYGSSKNESGLAGGDGAGDAGWLLGPDARECCSDSGIEAVAVGVRVAAGAAIGAGKAKSAPAPDAAAGDVYLLYLVRQCRRPPDAVAQSPYTQVVRLKNVDAGKAVYLMGWLTEPSGRGGSGDRLFLVYTDSTVQDWAAKIAGMLDVPADDDSDWAKAVRSLLEVAGPRFADPAVADTIVKQLEPLCLGQTDTGHRWPACMLAGRLLDEQLGRSREAAGRFEQAAAMSLKTSPAWLVARYAQALALRGAGDRAAAKAVAGDIVQNAAGGFQRTAAYREAQKMAQGK